MKQVSVKTTTIKTFKVHSQSATELLKETDLYALDQYEADELKARGLYLVSQTESVEVEIVE